MSGTVALTREAGNNSKLAQLLKDRGIHSVEVCTLDRIEALICVCKFINSVQLQLLWRRCHA
jgi:hypothetical protein